MGWLRMGTIGAAVALAGTAGCVTILGDFEVGAGSGSTDGGDTLDGSGGDGGTGEGGGGDGGAASLSCGVIPSTFRKVADLSGLDASTKRYQGIGVYRVGEERVRIVGQVSSQNMNQNTLYTIRSDRASDPTTTAPLPQALQQVWHQNAMMHFVIEEGGTPGIVALPDTADGSQPPPPASNVKLFTSLPAGSNYRIRATDVGSRDYFVVMGYEAGPQSFKAGTARASQGVPGTFFEVFSGPTALSFEGDALYRTGPFVYGFTSEGEGVTPTTPVRQHRFPILANAVPSNRDLSTGVFAGPVINSGPMTAQVLFADLTTPSAPFLRIGDVKESELFAFTVSSLAASQPLTDPDKIAVGPKGAIVVAPGLLAVMGRGSRANPPSTGLNFAIYDALTAQQTVDLTGTGTNLLAGNDRIESVAADYGKTIVGNSTIFEVAWIEHKMPGDFDELYFQRIQCDPK